MLATANKSRVSNRVTVTENFLVIVGGRPAKFFLTSSLMTMQNLVAVSHHAYAHVGSPKIWGMGMADP